MEALWEMLIAYPIGTRVAVAGFVIGALLGIVMHRSNFCTMGALSDINAFGDWRRFRTWVLAMAVAILSTQTLHYLGYIDLGKSIYYSSTFNWLAFIVGGLLFGIGMVFGSGCAARNLIRVGSGDMKALVVVMMVAVVAYMTLRGLLAPVRIALNDLAALDLGGFGLANTSLAGIIEKNIGSGLGDPVLLAGGAVAALMLIYCFASAAFRSSGTGIFAGIAIGLLVGLAWWATGVLGYDDFEPVALFAPTFVSPAGNTLQYLMTFTGASINFGIASVFGMLAGSFVSAVLQGRFHIGGFADKNDTLRHLIGGALMGSGAVISLGCTVGQGISGVSTLALGSFVALFAIIAGGFIGFKMMERGVLI